ncbi:hypothetical protein NMG60_11022001 [Bertholletia excelsa]
MILSKLSNTRRLSSSSSSNQRLIEVTTLQTLLKSGFSPTLNDLNQFLHSLFQAHKHKFLLQFVSQMYSNRIKGNSYTHSILTRALLEGRGYEEVEQYVKTHKEKSSLLQQNRFWDSLIQGFCIAHNNPEKALSVLKDCLQIEGVVPSSSTFSSLIRSFTSQGVMERAVEVLEIMTDEKINYPFDNFVCSSVVSGFVRIEKPELAIQFFENAVSSGLLQANIVTYTTIIRAYSKLGKLDRIPDLVSGMEKEGVAFDVVFCSSLIHEYLKEGFFIEALRTHGEMVKKKIERDVISQTILIDGFAKEGHVEKAVGLLNKMKKNDLAANLVTYTAILLGFCKKGKMEEAIKILEMIEDMGIELDEFAYATLIDGFSRRGDIDRIFHLLAEMEKKGISPSIVTYNTMINGLCKAKRTSEADDFSKGILGDVVTYSTLLHGYVEEENVMGIIETKRRLEEATVLLDVVMCNILIKAMFMVGSFEEAHMIYKRMPEMNLAANAVTYHTMIDGCCKFGRIDEALEIFDEFRMSSISSSACYNYIIRGLCKNGMPGLAIEVFMELHERSLASDEGIHKMIMEAIWAEQNEKGLLRFICRIQNLSNEIFSTICNDVIIFLCNRGFLGLHNVESALRFLDIMKEHKFTVTFPKTVLRTLTQNGRAGEASKLITRAEDNLPAMDVVDYSIVVDGLCKEGHVDKALDLCAFAKRKGVTLNIVTYNSIMNGLCHQGCFVEAFRLLDSLEKIDMIPSEITYATLIDTLSKEGLLADARNLFDSMILKGFKPNTRVCNSLINGYCKLNQMQEALKLFADLQSRQLKPDEFTVSTMINVFCQKGDMEGALEFFFEFKKKGLVPDLLGFIVSNILREMLQTQSVLELLKRAETEVDSDSIDRFLLSLCEQGSIQEAILVLNEVGSMYFPIPVFPNFNTYYSVIASLCSRGDLRKANELAKMLSFSKS